MDRQHCMRMIAGSSGWWPANAYATKAGRTDGRTDAGGHGNRIVRRFTTSMPLTRAHKANHAASNCCSRCNIMLPSVPTQASPTLPFTIPCCGNQLRPFNRYRHGLSIDRRSKITRRTPSSHADGRSTRVDCGRRTAVRRHAGCIVSRSWQETRFYLSFFLSNSPPISHGRAILFSFPAFPAPFVILRSPSPEDCW